MYIREKINMDLQGLMKEGPITIVAFGDSVTHGAVGAGEIDYETVYWNRLKQKINSVRGYVPVNVINAGIGGLTAEESLPRLKSQVLKHEPDLIIVCFGLNDVNRELERFTGSLKTIFEKCKESGAQVIFMTPNMLNTSVYEDTEPQFFEYAAVTAEIQNSGKMDLYMQSAVRTAIEAGVEICDCYAEWKKLSQTEDITKRLANRINHPTREMHGLFAAMLFDIIFRNSEKVNSGDESTMYRG